MEMMIIYDTSGRVLLCSSDLTAPQGVPYIVSNIPENSVVKSVDTTSQTHRVILETLMNETDYRIKELEDALLLQADSEIGGIL